MTSLRMLLVVLVAMIATAVPASAHVRLLASDPESGQALATPPQSIRLTFDGPLKAAPVVTVTDPNGTEWAMGRPTMDQKVVTIPTDPKQGPAGQYVVNYRVTGQDDHLIVGNIAFDLTAPFGQPGGAAAGGTQPVTPVSPVNAQQPADHEGHQGHAQPSTPDTGGIPLWVSILGALAVVAIGVSLIVMIRRRR